MLIKNQIDKNSPIGNDDFLKIIEDFESSGKTIDDRGRNKIKTFVLNGVTVNTKSFKIPNAVNKFVYKFLRKPKASRSFEFAIKLLEKGIKTPTPYAYYEYFTPFSIQNSYYFSEHLNYDLTFTTLLKNPDYPDHENILRQFTKFTWQMHEQGIYFKDHSPGNTLIVKKGGNYDFYLIDLNRMNFFELDLDARMRNFSRLTEKDEVIKIMSDEYAKLIAEPFEKIYQKMRDEINKFRFKQNKKQQFKKRYLGK